MSRFSCGSSRRRLLVVASWFPDESSKVAGIFVAEQARALFARHDVSVVVPLLGAPHGTAGRVEDTSRYPFPVVRLATVASGSGTTLRAGLSLAGEVRRQKPDLLHAHVTLPAGLLSVLAGLMHQIPVVVTEHIGPFSLLMRTWRDRAKVRFALKHAQAVVPVASGLAKQMKGFGIRRELEVIPNLVDAKRFAFKPPRVRCDGAVRLVFVGRLNDQVKNLPCLVRALSEVVREGKLQCRLRVVGGGQREQEAKQLASQLGVSSLCEFAGELDNESVAEALAASDIFVLPSLFENCPVALLEALAIGRPAIVSACGAREWVTPETGVVVPVDDPSALASAIEDMGLNLGRYSAAQISRYAHERFSDEVIVERLTGIYERVLGA